ncbi:MAG TPA: C-GCAxxG-C-C family protein [Anaerolineales bacterium]|nr:C-GCAxxG-C-C family protein [Anaerolineales bacterium]
MTEALQIAGGRFARGYNCAQSVFSAFAVNYGVSSDLAVRLSAAFGGGMARKGEVCGALTGALMILGLQYGRGRPEDKEEIYRLARQFIDSFEERHGSIRCADLLGHDISTPDGLQSIRDNNLFATVCPMLVDELARALKQFLESTSSH